MQICYNNSEIKLSGEILRGEKMQTIIIVSSIVVIILVMLIGIYNGPVELKNRVSNAWSQIDVQLKQRSDLIPNIVESVKGYSGYENNTLNEVIDARSRALNSTSREKKIKSEGELTKTISKLLMLVENYPDLKANENFLDLQDQLKKIENKISISRQFYNDTVLKYENKRQSFPTVLFAGMLGFKQADYFEISEEDREVPKVKFDM